ncbi:MAG: isochorismatase family protein [Acidaminococcaceae bacterium]|nr:isochorismatase family protein [Acidaminococcaceae bacterium]
MLTKLPAKAKIAAFDIDVQNTFTPICPDELPVAEGDQIVSELNAQAALAALRIGSRDAHSPQAVWIADSKHPVLSPVSGYPDVDVRWPSHAIIGTKGFDFIEGLDPKAYDFQVYKGIEIDKHPYGACYHDLANTLSTGVIEYLREHGVTTVICGGLATDYCVKNTVLQLRAAGFEVILNLAACRGIAPDTVAAALAEMRAQNITIVENTAELKNML